MAQYLTVDIGAGTMDILYVDSAEQQHYKAVVKSPVLRMAERIAARPGNLAITGVEMGGGPVAAILKERAKTADVVITPSAAATLHHDPRRVAEAGIRILPEDDVAGLRRAPHYHHVELADLSPDDLRRIVAGFGVPWSFDAVGICAQDHGVAPPGTSHLDYRHQLMRRALAETPSPHSLLHPAGNIPETFNRLTAIAETARALPTDRVYVMDSGMAAILGASRDPLRRGKQRILVLDIATSHTVGATLVGDEIAGVFEYHTHDITPRRLAGLIRNLAEGTLTHAGILAEGGHGAYMRRAVGYADLELILATGPKRRLLFGSDIPFSLGAPMGDNMMTGTSGLLAAIRRVEGQPQLDGNV